MVMIGKIFFIVSVCLLLFENSKIPPSSERKGGIKEVV
jgi:hypothetical protein